MELDDPVQYVKGVGPRRAQLLAALNIETVADLLTYYPRAYSDRTNLVDIIDLSALMTATVKGEVRSVRVNRWRRVVNVRFADDTGNLECVWFNQTYLAGDPKRGTEPVFKKGDWFYLTGKVTEFHGKLQMANPEYEQTDPEEEDQAGAGILPIYGLTEGLRQHQLRRIVRNAIDTCGDALVEVLPGSLLKANHLSDIGRATAGIHFPLSFEHRDAARRRLIYEEFFLLETAMALRRASIERENTPWRIRVTPKIDERIRARFPFQLTDAQERVVREISADLSRPHPMNRLLQGDVGSGKTVVALYAMLSAVANGFQAALMAPTEVLAEQHFETFSNTFLSRARVRLARLTGGMTGSERSRLLSEIRTGEVDIVFGTHALIEPDVEFARLALVVVDEQHKFGVVQRAELRAKGAGASPHCLVMTATPIPRTLMLTVFGDLDVSVIDQMPPGRKRIVTKFVTPKKRADAFEFIRKEIAKGRQAYFVYPLIEESEAIKQVRSATRMAKRLGEDVFGEFNVELLTGRMIAAEKNRIMNDFRTGAIQILVATVVIEVGVDVPNATVMVIENAERFGLSQLHQLRGRIGRGAHRSYCLLFGKAGTDEAKLRLKAIAKIDDGFEIAEEDLRIRGPGEFFGTRQHGLPELRIANLVTDYDLLKLSAADARKLIASDPKLQADKHKPLRKAVLDRFAERLELIDV